MPIVRQMWSILAAVCVAATLTVGIPQFAGCAARTSGMGSVLLPQTFNERIAAGYVLVSTVRETATTLLNAGKLSAQDGANVLQVTDVARDGLNVARSLAATDLTSAEAKLAATNTALVALQQYLSTRGAQ
jgi:predicted membrane metal-binding protein